MYTREPLFSYAEGFYMLLPSGLPKRFYKGDGEYVFTNDYVIYFKPDTPEDIKNRLIEDYSKYVANKKVSGIVY